MLETIILALIVAKIKGYKIKKIFLFWQFYVILVLELLYFIIQVNFFKHNYTLLKYVGILETIYLSSYLLLIIEFKLYKGALYGSLCIFIGSLLNKIAIGVNGGKMPVFPSLTLKTGYMPKESLNTIDNLHILGDHSTNLPFLTDIFDIGYSILSIGDIFIRAFVFIIIYQSVKFLNNNNHTI